MAEQEKNPYEIEVTLKGRVMKLDVRNFGQGLTLGQIEQIENEFDVELHEINRLSPSTFSGRQISAWLFGLALPKVPSLTAGDVRSLPLEFVSEIFEQLGENLDPDDNLDDEGAAADGAPDPLDRGDSATTHDDSGSPG